MPESKTPTMWFNKELRHGRDLSHYAQQSQRLRLLKGRRERRTCAEASPVGGNSKRGADLTNPNRSCSCSPSCCNSYRRPELGGDVPFALLYLIEEKQVRLASAERVDPGGLTPTGIELGAGSNEQRSCPLGEAARTKSVQGVDDLADRFDTCRSLVMSFST